MTVELIRFCADVKRELIEMEKFGIVIPHKAWELVGDYDYMSDLVNMKVRECADALLDVAHLVPAMQYCIMDERAHYDVDNAAILQVCDVYSTLEKALDERNRDWPGQLVVDMKTWNVVG